jgi:hypothetical protein
MQYRLLGRSGLKVSVFSLGAMTFGGSGMFATMGSTRGAEARRQIDMCLEAGVNLFDTADIYSAGESEVLLSAALGVRRPQVLVATNFMGKTGKGVNDIGASRLHIISACEASLKRLNTDYSTGSISTPARCKKSFVGRHRECLSSKEPVALGRAVGFGCKSNPPDGQRLDDALRRGGAQGERPGCG